MGPRQGPRPAPGGSRLSAPVDDCHVDTQPQCLQVLFFQEKQEILIFFLVKSLGFFFFFLVKSLDFFLNAGN